jgi:hypothetical protein
MTSWLGNFWGTAKAQMKALRLLGEAALWVTVLVIAAAGSGAAIRLFSLGDLGVFFVQWADFAFALGLVVWRFGMIRSTGGAKNRR